MGQEHSVRRKFAYGISLEIDGSISSSANSSLTSNSLIHNLDPAIVARSEDHSFPNVSRSLQSTPQHSRKPSWAATSLEPALSRKPSLSSHCSTVPDSLEPRHNYSFFWDEGRRYTSAYGSCYILPSDDTESDRLMQLHFLLKWIFEGNFKAPVADILKNSGTRVLDAGCGPGTWILDTAHTFTHTEFYGVDISPVFPTSIKSINTHFSIANLLEGLPFEDGYFDYTHQRMLAAALQVEQWPRVIAELVRVTKPGGWIELVEINQAALRGGPRSTRILKALNDFMQSKKLNPYAARLLHKQLESAGIVDIQHNYISIPTNWPKDHSEGDRLGSLMHDAIKEFLIAVRPFLGKVMGLNAEQYDEEVEGVLAECTTHRTLFNCYYAFGRVPERNN